MRIRSSYLTDVFVEKPHSLRIGEWKSGSENKARIEMLFS